MLVLVLAAAVLAVAAPVRAVAAVRVLAIPYTAHDGRARRAYVVLPSWYGPRRHPAIPLVISPHGRNESPVQNVRTWGNLPAVGRFAVVAPEGQGRKLILDSWGAPGEIRDLSRMPQIVSRALPWLRIDRARIYAIGDSMGGQEVLLLAARHPELLVGAAAFDAPANLASRYNAFGQLSPGSSLRKLLAYEVGGPPWLDPRAYALRSPLSWARELAFSDVSLQIWWSRRDQIVRNQAQQSGLLFRRIIALNPRAPVEQYIGYWRHGKELRKELPVALHDFGLAPPFRGVPNEPDFGRTTIVRP